MEPHLKLLDSETQYVCLFIYLFLHISIEIVFKERKDATSRDICKVGSFIRVRFSSVGSGCPKLTLAMSNSHHHVEVLPCPVWQAISPHQIQAWKDCWSILLCVPTFITYSKVSFEVVICHSMPDLSLWIRVLLKFSHTSSPGWLCLWIVTLQHAPCLHMVLSKVITVEIPEVSACV